MLKSHDCRRGIGVILAGLACALAALLGIHIAQAQSDFDREKDRKSMTEALYAAYRDYQYVKLCHDRQHFWATLISDDELQKAKEKILVVETDTLAWLNDAWHKEQNVDTDALYAAAGESLNRPGFAGGMCVATLNKKGSRRSQ
jgi:hypothetical protein